MKIRHFLVMVVFWISGIASPIDSNGQPTPALLELLDLLQVDCQPNLESIVEKTQEKWFQGKDKERWEFERIHEEKAAQVQSLLDQMGLIHPIEASKKDYDYALVLGALSSRMRERLKFLGKLWNQGVRFKNIVLLTGQRDKVESLESFPPDVKTETDMFIWLYKYLDLPEEMKKLPLTVVDAPKVWNSDFNQYQRPRTVDTVIAWLKQNPQPGTCLAISNQPYVGYQETILKTYLPSAFTVEGAGGPSPSYSSLPISIHLDNLARWLYQLKQLREKS